MGRITEEDEGDEDTEGDEETGGQGSKRPRGNNIALDIIEAWALHVDGFEGSYIFGSQGG